MNSRFESLTLTPNSPLSRFSESERKTIEDKLHALSTLAYFVGKDFGMKVEVNPQEGWHWDFNKNVVRADPDDLLTKPIEFLRFVMSHEAGHRRISRVTGIIPDDVWGLPGFAFMSNAIEDPRDNNFVADNVPHFRNEMKFAYGEESDEAQFEAEMKGEAVKKFGKSPRFMQAGFEYIKLWYKISVGKEPTLSEDLPDDVREVVLKTLDAVKQSWNTYPSLKEANEGLEYQGKQLSGEEAITEYARASFQINYTQVWPLFNTLITKDIEDAKNDSKPPQGAPDTENEKPLTEEEIKELIKEFADKLAEHFEGEKDKKDIPNGPQISESVPSEPFPSVSPQKSDNGIIKDPVATPDAPAPGSHKLDEAEIEKVRQKFEHKEKKESLYAKTLREYAPLIDQLTNELREIFDKRKHTRWKAGYKSGKKIHIGKAIQEEVAQTSPFETEVFMRKEQPGEADYAITLLIDLSASMDGEKIKEAYKATLVLMEVLTQIGITFSVRGFNNRILSYKDFEQIIDNSTRNAIEHMFREVKSSNSGYNDDGWALNETHRELGKREESQKIIFVISDGRPVPSSAHKHYDLGVVVRKIIEENKVKIIGLGLGKGTKHVEHYYPNSVADIDVQELAKVLGSKLREVIESQ